jgi:hypothetical protein
VVSPVSRRVSQLSRLAKGTKVSMASCTSITSRTWVALPIFWLACASMQGMFDEWMG